MFTVIFYIWGLLNSLGMLKTMFYDKKLIINSSTDPEKYKKDIMFSFFVSISTFLWVLIGIFSVQSLWFLLYIIYIIISSKLINIDIVKNPSWYNLWIIRLRKFTSFVMVVFPIANHFYFKIALFTTLKLFLGI